MAAEATLLAGERVQLFGARALHWPAQRMLVVADLHLGKGDVFRRAGLAVPRGGTRADLWRLQQLLQATDARQLLVLGDFVHGPVADAPWRAQWQQWRARHAHIGIDVVAGNHDRQLRRAAGLADLLGITLHTAPLQRPPFVFAHATEDVPASIDGYVLSGHLHPVVRLPGLPRLPVFAFGAGAGVLPAFTQFSGGQPIWPAQYRQWYICAPAGAIAAGHTA
ncbi:hypothetical protein AAV94_09685 [Lampropedia cohaerens]|uniref:Calcineurin-like phosphoesterase domain-containing protein n=2 Tax=Lampropedia cohaerens TaxID=1610491 RepID=A0A0U1PYJ1_9BURK|nr:hypothetical protein AAV94_09685 [Lampropedia cohaerens]